ncbi:YppG-like protein [Lentibacillus halodurans]|uniref:YppG-like protein n=1 Tax=Lentibacillus halodurans TaxID=237679 RepID=A0A1I0XTY1_9BACI|nr:YppG family protein [Lentibacillus halodurans]SFB04364.1 YppG-like protein [Lentibacillus halodurans]
MVRRPYPYPPMYSSNPADFYPYPSSSANPHYPSQFPTPFEVYSKPKQPMNWEGYPQPGAISSHPPLPNHLLYYFQDHNGELDLDKMLSTAGQVANTVQQISPMVKQVGDFMKQFR